MPDIGPWIFAGPNANVLCQRLVEEIGGRAREDPFLPDVVLVGSRGMARWLRSELASRLGLCMNVRYEFLARGLSEQLGRVCGLTETPMWDVGQMALALLAEKNIPVCDDQHLAWARRLAEVLDKLAAFRPEWLQEMAAGKKPGPLDQEASQDLASSWQALEEHLGRGHLWHLLQRASAASAPPISGAPVYVFGLSTMAPLYFQAVRLLGRLGLARLFLLAPSPAAAQKSRVRAGGCRLARSLGRLSRFFLGKIEEKISWLPAQKDAIPRASLLAAVQRAVVDDLPGERAAGAGITAEDFSIQVHSCHGPLRQVEALRDALLDLFERQPNLEPRQILIMTPALESFAPLVEAVFSQPSNDGPAGRNGVLPLRVVDLQPRQKNRLAAALARLWEMVGQRLTSSAVIDLLFLEPVRLRFGLEAQRLEELAGLLREAGLRWGADAAEHQRHGLPAEEANTVEFALARLAAGVVCAREQDWVRAGEKELAPARAVAGERAALFGKLAEFLTTLTQVLERLRLGSGDGAATLAQWRDLTLAAAQRLCAQLPEFERERGQLLGRLDELVEAGRRARFTGRITGRAFRQELLARLSDSGGDLSRSQAITLCSLKPMRSVPFEVVCLLGLEDDAFPRRGLSPAAEWLVEGNPWRDGDGRAEDQNLFLETLLSAGKCFLVTYTGRHPQSGEKLHPPGAVSMLVELAAACGAEENSLIKQHPLQPFSPRYFQKGQPLTFNRWAWQVAGSLRRGRQPWPGLFGPGSESLPPEPAPAEPLRLSLDELVAFFRHPARYLLRRRLGIRLQDSDERTKDREPIDLDGLENWRLGRRLLDGYVREPESGPPRSEILRHLRAEGLLPWGEAGKSVFDRAWERISALMTGELRSLLRDSSLSPLRVVLDGANNGERPLQVVLEGRVRLVEKGPLLLFLEPGPAEKPRPMMLAWTELLAAGAVLGGKVRAEIFGLENDGDGARCQRLALMVSDAAAAMSMLRGLVELYFEGNRRPLPLPEKAAFDSVFTSQDVWESYHGNDFIYGDRDSYWEAVFPGAGPIELEEFRSLAGKIWKPVREHLVEVPNASDARKKESKKSRSRSCKRSRK